MKWRPAIFVDSLNIRFVIKEVLHIHIQSTTVTRCRRDVDSDALGVSVTRCHVQSCPTFVIRTGHIRLMNEEILQTNGLRAYCNAFFVYANDLIVSMARGLVKSIPSFVVNGVHFRPVIKENLRRHGCTFDQHL